MRKRRNQYDKKGGQQEMSVDTELDNEQASNQSSKKSGSDEEKASAESIPFDETSENEKNVAVSECESESEIEKLNATLSEQKMKYLRLSADFDNFRKRSSKEITAARTIGKLETITPVLQIFDHFNMAVSASESAENMDAIREGLKMIVSETKKIMDELGLMELNAIGSKFDPELHEAVAREPSTEHEEDIVIKQWRCGYKINDKLLRPATVVVSSGAPKEEND